MDYFELLKGSGGTKKQGGWFSDLLLECSESAKKKVNEQGGPKVGPIELTPEQFDTIVDTLYHFSDVSEELGYLEGKGNVTIMFTDGERFVGVDPQGSEYPRYKTEVGYSEADVYYAAANKVWYRKHIKTEPYESKAKVNEVGQLEELATTRELESKKVDEQEDDHPSGHIHHGDKVKVLRGGYKGDVGEVVDIMTPEEDPEDMPDGQFDVKLPSGKMIYLGWDDVELVESKVNELDEEIGTCPHCGYEGEMDTIEDEDDSGNVGVFPKCPKCKQRTSDIALHWKDNESKVNELDEPDLERPEKARRRRPRPVRRPELKRKPRRPEPDVDKEGPEPEEEPRDEEPKEEPREKPKVKPVTPPEDVPEIGAESDRDDVPPPPEEITDPEQPIEMRKEYLGRSEDIHYYFVTMEGEGGAIDDLVIADQEGVKKYSGSDHDIEVSEENIADFIIDAIRDLKIAQIERSIFMKYVYPKLEQYAPEEDMLEEPEEEEDEFEKEKKPFGQEEEEERPRRMAASKSKYVSAKFLLEKWDARKNVLHEAYKVGDRVEAGPELDVTGGGTVQDTKADGGLLIEWDDTGKRFWVEPDEISRAENESKNLIEMQVIDGMGNEFAVNLADGGDTTDAVITINGREFRFSGDFAAMWRDERGGISETGLEELALDALAMMEENEYQELLANAERAPDDDVIVDDAPKSIPGETDWPLKDRPVPDKGEDLTAPPIAPATDDVDLSKADVVDEPEGEVKRELSPRTRHRPKKPVLDQPEDLENENIEQENKENENVIEGDEEMSKTAKDLLQEAEGLEAQAAELRKEADVLAEKDSVDEGIAPDPKASQEDIIKKLLEAGITETDVAKGTKALVLLAKEALKAGNYAELGDYAIKLAEIEAMIPPEAESEAEKVDPDDKAPEKKDDKPAKKDKEPDKKDDDKAPEKKDDVPEIGDKEKKKEGPDEKKSPPHCDKCDKAHWPFDKCSESEEVDDTKKEEVAEGDKKEAEEVDEAKKKDAAAKAKKEKEEKEAKAKKDKKEKEAKAKKEKEAKAKAKESKIPVEEPDEDLSESKSLASLKNLLGLI